MAEMISSVIIRRRRDPSLKAILAPLMSRFTAKTLDDTNYRSEGAICLVQVFQCR